MIEINKFTFKYQNGNKTAVNDINLKIEDGGFVGIIGNSGAGKTTLTYAINGVIPHHFKGDFYGEVLINGLDTVDNKPEILSAIVGSVFQDVDAQMVASVVEDELLFGLENFSVPKEEIEKRMTDALEKVGIRELRHRTISSLSGGQKQKVAVAAIIALRPQIIVLDEPTGELDPSSSRQLFEILRELNREFGITIVVVEQKIMLLCEYCKQLGVMEKGRLACFGTVGEVMQNSAEQMQNMGINVPRIVTLYNALAEKNLYRGNIPVNVEAAKKMVEEALV